MLANENSTTDMPNGCNYERRPKTVWQLNDACKQKSGESEIFHYSQLKSRHNRLKSISGAAKRLSSLLVKKPDSLSAASREATKVESICSYNLSASSSIDEHKNKDIKITKTWPVFTINVPKSHQRRFGSVMRNSKKLNRAAAYDDFTDDTDKSKKIDPITLKCMGHDDALHKADTVFSSFTGGRNTYQNRVLYEINDYNRGIAKFIRKPSSTKMSQNVNTNEEAVSIVQKPVPSSVTYNADADLSKLNEMTDAPAATSMLNKFSCDIELIKDYLSTLSMKSSDQNKSPACTQTEPAEMRTKLSKPKKRRQLRRECKLQRPTFSDDTKSRDSTDVLSIPKSRDDKVDDAIILVIIDDSKPDGKIDGYKQDMLIKSWNEALKNWILESTDRDNALIQIRSSQFVHDVFRVIIENKSSFENLKKLVYSMHNLWEGALLRLVPLESCQELKSVTITTKSNIPILTHANILKIITRQNPQLDISHWKIFDMEVTANSMQLTLGLDNASNVVLGNSGNFIYFLDSKVKVKPINYNLRNKKRHANRIYSPKH